MQPKALASDVTRCRTTAPCPSKDACARYQTPVPPMGSVSDFMPYHPYTGYSVCTMFMPIEPAKPVDKPAREVKPWPVAN